MGKRKSRAYKHLRPTRNEIEKRSRVLVIDSKEATEDFYSILFALQKSKGGGLIDKEALNYVTKWMNFILERDPEVEKRIHDTRGPFRKRDTTPLNISLKLDYKERALMLFIWKTMYSELITPEVRDDWIKNHGPESYETAIKNYKAWISSLEGADLFINTQGGDKW